MYTLLKEPTLDNFRKFFCSHTGEHNSIDFKAEWIEDAKLAKEILAIANSHGGIIIFGVTENSDKTLTATGLPQLLDKAIISNKIKKYISSDLKYEVYDFSFTSSEYEELKGKNFQMLVIDDTPNHLPFLAKKDYDNILKANFIYVRRGTSCEIANQEEINNIINRKINFLHPNSNNPLKLDEHLKQLKTLYESINKKFYLSPFSNITFQEYFATPKLNPKYPKEDYEDFIIKMIETKKRKIERILDLY